MKPLTLEDEINFGKHAGQQVEDLIEDHPGYVRWLIEETDNEFDETVLEALEKREARRH